MGGLWFLINLQRNDCGAYKDGRGSNRIRSEGPNVQPEHKIVSAFPADPPKWLAEQFIALPAMKLVEKIFEITRRRLLVTLQPKQPRDFVVVKVVHFRAG